MKLSNNKLLIGLILLIVAGTIIYAISSNHEHKLENLSSFSLHNDDEIEHKVFVVPAIADDSNKINNNSLMQSCGNIKYVMMFGNYSDPLTVEEINDVTNLIIF